MALFIDLKGAFDIMDREVLIEGMRERERERREGLIKRIEKLFRETKSIVRVEESTGKDFLDGEKGETRLPFKSVTI